MEKQEFVEKRGKYFSTQGSKKLWNYFLEYAKTDYFIKTVADLRLKYKIPKNGFQTDNYRFPPEDWIFKNNKNKSRSLNKEIDKVCKKLALHYMDWYEVIEDYIFYNRLVKPEWHLNSYNLCLIRDVIEDKREYPGGKDFERSDDFAYPVALRISPYASLRDILDYVKKIYKVEILPLQKQYKDQNIKIGRVRTKNLTIQKRNKFIYENRNSTHRKIMDMVNTKFPEKFHVDHGNVGKIISLEKKKRKQM